MDGTSASESYETVIIGGGQAGLAVGYHLARRDRPFIIVDANERIGDSWRNRWDSLRLFTPARFSGLPGWRFPAPAGSFPTKDEAADYLETYAARFDLTVRTGVRVDRLSKEGDRYVITSGDRRFETDQVVVASGAYHSPRGARLRLRTRSEHHAAAFQQLPGAFVAAQRRRSRRRRRQFWS